MVSGRTKFAGLVFLFFLGVFSAIVVGCRKGRDSSGTIAVRGAVPSNATVRLARTRNVSAQSRIVAGLSSRKTARGTAAQTAPAAKELAMSRSRIRAILAFSRRGGVNFSYARSLRRLLWKDELV